MKEFTINIPDEVIEGIKKRVADYPWGKCYMATPDSWEAGTDLEYLKEFCKYWVEKYDWRTHEAELNRFPQYMATVDGIDIHFIMEKGSGDAPKPLLMAHGWPGSVCEFTKIIEPLAHPERFGGKEEDAFTVIAPSLPGFAFSGRPSHPMGPRGMARVLNKPMVDVLGITSYIAQGGDWGSAICSWLGYDYSGTCKAIHFNFPTMRNIAGPQTPEEQAWADQLVVDQVMEDGYRTQQATKPQSLSYAMVDSPVGTAAWILEKFNTWSDTKGDDVESAHTKDDLLTNIMVYILTNSFNSASWIYYGRREEGGRIMVKEDGRRVEVPTACALFPAEMLAWPPRSYFERMYNIVRWTKMPHGGHFAAMEEPQLLMDDLRAFARDIRL